MEKSADRSPKLLNIWSVQCEKCHKWRLIPTQEEYEQIRSTITEQPFDCSRRPNVSCNDHADLDYDNTRTWTFDRPNLPKTPEGFRRNLVMRKDYSKIDCYYVSPDGKRMRSITEVPSFLKQNPKFKKLSTADFSFTAPRIIQDTVPKNLAMKGPASARKMQKLV